MSEEKLEPACGNHDWGEKKALTCAGWFEGKFHSNNFRRCSKAAVIVFELSNPGVYGSPGKEYRMKNAFAGACEEHEANRRQSYQVASQWDIVREFPASELKGGGA